MVQTVTWLRGLSKEFVIRLVNKILVISDTDNGCRPTDLIIN